MADKFKTEVDALGKALSAVGNLDEAGQKFVVRSMVDRLGLNMTAVVPQTAAGQQAGTAPSGMLPQHSGTVEPKHFMDQKKPTKDIERVACLAYYLTHYRSLPHFKTADITKMNTDAAQTALSNTSVAVSNAERAGYITQAGKHAHKQITAYGEKLVSALPDQEAFKEVLAAESKRHTRRKKAKKSAK